MKNIYLISLLLFFQVNLLSQSLSGELILNTTPSPYLSEWQRNFTSMGMLRIYNPNSIIMQVKFRANISKSGSGTLLYVLSEPTNLTGEPIQIITNPLSLRYSDINITNIELRNRVIQTGRLPEGEYTLCINIEDLNGNTLVSNICGSFSISFPNPPSLISPQDNTTLETSNPYPLFLWTPVTLPPNYRLTYRLRIVEVLEGQSPIQAINSNIVFYENNNINTNNFTYPIDAPVFEEGKTYAWQVQVLDQFGIPPTQNDGKSEIFTFTIAGSLTAGGLSISYPENNDTIPWKYFPIIFRFDPYSDSYTKCEYTFQLSENGRTLYTKNRTGGNALDWPNGPRRSQQSALGGISISEEQAQHISLNRRLNESPSPPQFRSGSNYYWSADIEIKSRNRTAISGILDGYFSVGMGTPILNQPALNDTVAPGTVIFQFKTSNPPRRLVPPFPILQSGGGAAHFFNGFIAERWVLELSRNRDMNGSIRVASGLIGEGIDLNNAIQNPSNAINSIYRDISITHSILDTGWYYWRVKWLRNPNDTLSEAYRTSEIFKFYVGYRRTPIQRDTTVPASCIASCEAPPIPEDQKVPVTTATVGSVLQIGLFSMTVTEINWSGQTASGKGTIRVPFLRAPIKVSFNNIKVNNQNRIYEGEVRSEYDNESVIPSNLTSLGKNIGSISESDVQNLHNYVSQEARRVSSFFGTTPIGMPIGFDKVVEDRRYTIAIVSLVFKPQIAELNAMIALDFPELNGWLGLGAKEICFHPNGLGGIGRGMLYLPLDKDYSWSDEIKVRLKGTKFSDDYSTVTDSGTYVQWDCSGFLSLNISGEIVFSRNFLVEDLSSGEIGNDTIIASFKTNVRRHGNWISGLTFNKPFQIKGVNGFGFQVQEAWLDFSDAENPSGFTYPGASGINTNWKGFFLKRAAFKLPSHFRSTEVPDQRIGFSVNNLVIDRSGLTFSIRAENVLRSGNLDGWWFSIDTIYFDMSRNSFQRAGFNGNIKPSFTDSSLFYNSVISLSPSNELSYSFRLHPRSSINANLWLARLELSPTSNISINIDRNGLYARAELNGSMSINTDLPGVGRTSFTAMRFEGLAFQTREPYLVCPGNNCVRFGSASPQKFIAMENLPPEPNALPSNGSSGGFPVSINNIGLATQLSPEGKFLAGIEFSLSLNLMGESNSFGASTRLAILGALNFNATNGLQVWSFDRVQIDSVSVSGSVGVVSLEGYLRFYNQDATYGNGLKGFVRATFRPNISAQVAAQFGSVRNFRYWFVDAQVLFNPGITVFAGLDIYGFGGGAWYKMRRSTPLPNAQALTTADTTGKSSPGATLSGVTYLPDNNVAFGFEAVLIFGNTGGGQTYNADVGFSAEFNNNGGVNSMSLNGNVYLMTEITNRTNVPIQGSARITYDFQNNVFNGTFNVTINYSPILTGNANVWIHFSDTTWHVLVGTPSRPFDLNVLNIATFNAYIMVGKNLPPPPPLPANVLSIIGTSMTFPARDVSLTESGDGFAFGARFDINTGRIAFGPFFARLALGTGFDMALKNYGNVVCEGMSPGSRIGIDGWYASGQMYAYIEGAIGLFVDVWFVQGEFTILEIGAAAALQGGLPNPTWLRGRCGGYYNILGGLVQGNCSFEFQVGDVCRIPQESPLASIRILESLDPSNNSTNVDPYVLPVALFNAEVNRAFDLEQIRDDGSRVQRRFRFVIEKFELKQGGITIPANIQIAEDKLSAVLVPLDMLKGNTDYNVTIRIRGEEFLFPTNIWTPALNRSGQVIYAELSHNFRTGNAPDHIPARTVAYSYPFHGQRYFLIDECNKGVVVLKQGRPDLFSVNEPGYNQEYLIRFIPVDAGEPVVEAPIQYDSYRRAITFQIPSNLQTNKTYAAQIIRKRIPIRDPLGIASQQLQTSLNQRLQNLIRYQYVGTSDMLRVRRGRIDGRLTRSTNEKLYYVFFFRTSNFRNLQSKLNSITPRLVGRDSVAALFVYSDRLIVDFNAQEWFDVFDVNGYRYSIGLTEYRISPLVKVQDGLNNPWFNTFANPIIYQYYNNLRPYISRDIRNNLPFGIPPVNTAEINNPINGLSESEYLPQAQSQTPQAFGGITISYTGTGTGLGISGSGQGLNPSMFRYNMNLYTASIAFYDHFTLRNLTSEFIARYGHPSTSTSIREPLRTQMLNYLNSRWTSYKRGTYRFKFFYVPEECIAPDVPLPGYFKTFNY
ncbi:MAG: hypothetical protein N3F03_01925 [Ignavibacteria bacterium]|nr:hypothetical protein [Ignavibacteria bacterium]